MRNLPVNGKKMVKIQKMKFHYFVGIKLLLLVSNVGFFILRLTWKHFDEKRTKINPTELKKKKKSMKV